LILRRRTGDQDPDTAVFAGHRVSDPVD